MSIAKRLISGICSVSCILSLTYTHVSASTTEITPIDGCGVTVEVTESGTYVYGIPPRLMPSLAETLFDLDVEITSPSGVTSTGDTLTLYNGAEAVETATVIIRGDVNCDGMINGKDIVRLSRYLSDPTTQLDLLAADVNSDGVVNADDTYCISEKTLSEISSATLVRLPFKTSYYSGEKFSTDGMILLGTYSNGDTYAICTGFDITYQNGDSISDSDTYVSVSYGGVFSENIDITVAKSNIYELSEYVDQVITISTEGIHTFVGTSENTQIVVDAEGLDVTLIFSDADMTYTGDDAPVSITSANSVTLISSQENRIADTEANLTESVIYSKAPLTLEGDGTLNIDANIAEGITVSKTAFVINSGNYVINSVGNGIQTKGSGVSFTVNGGVFDISAGGNGIKNSKTAITINDGDFTITAGGDGIQAETSLDIFGGTFDITTSGGYASDSGNSTSSAWVYELVAQADMPTTEEEYYGLYILSGTTYIEIDDSNYSTYSSYTTLYDRNSSKGIKANTDITVQNAKITLNCLDDGIKADGAFTLNSGNVTIKSACDGIQSDTILTVNSGIIDIECTGAFYQDNTNGKFKYENGEYVRTSSDNGGRPGGMGGSSSSTLYALFNSGKGLKAESELYINGGDITISGIDDTVHCDGSVYVTNGNITVTTEDDGIHAELSVIIGSLTDNESDPYINITNSYEGVEGIYIDIYSGTTVLTASDDGINAAGDLEASSSYYLNFDNTCKVYVTASGDGLDANGYMYVNGGNVYVFGPTGGGNGIIDYDSNFEIRGGTFLAIGSSDMAQTATTASQYVLGFKVSQGSFSSGTYVNVTGADITVKLPVSYGSSILALVSSPEFSNGNTYSLSYGGTYSGGNIVNNVCEGGTYSGGTSAASITTTSTLIASNSNFNSGGSNRPF